MSFLFQSAQFRIPEKTRSAPKPNWQKKFVNLQNNAGYSKNRHSQFISR